MRIGKCIIIYALLLCFLADANAADHTPGITKKKRETLALAKINALPEVKYFLRMANKHEEPVAILDGDPDSTWNYYRVKVGYSKDMFRTVLSFFIAPKNYNIYYWDIMDEANDNPINLISLQQWRRWRNTAGWQKPHIFKNGKLIVLTNESKIGKPVQKKK